MRVLVVDDDPAALHYLTVILQDRYDVTACTSGTDAIAWLEKSSFDVVFADLRMPQPDGFAVLRVAQDLVPPVPVFVLSAMNTARAAVDALRLGARDFLIKPARPQDIAQALLGLAGGAPDDRRAGEGPELPPRSNFGLVGDSAPMRLVRSLIPRLAASHEAVLVLGETGTGKELLARALHTAGPRRSGPLVTHNMAATPGELAESLFFGHVRGAFTGACCDHPGLFEQADGGTLFLDELDSLPLALQAKLLRALESGRVQRVGSANEREVDVRVVAATALDVADLVATGAFRADLYYRLKQLEMMLPPVRERASDIPALVNHFLHELAVEAGKQFQIMPGALDLLTGYSWPGNVRELRNAIRAGAVLAGGGPIRPEHLPREVLRRKRIREVGRVESLRCVESEHIMKAVESVGGNHSRAARLLGIDRGTLARKLSALARKRSQE